MSPALAAQAQHDPLAQLAVRELTRHTFYHRRQIRIHLMDRAGRLTDRQRKAHRLESCA